MTYRDAPSRLQRWLHRRGIARRLSATHADHGVTQTYVETALPWPWLARVAARTETRKPHERWRESAWCWRWIFVPESTRRYDARAATLTRAAQHVQDRPNTPHPYPSDQTAARSATGRQEGP